jgi:hypothetical protein
MLAGFLLGIVDDRLLMREAQKTPKKRMPATAAQSAAPFFINPTRH